MSASASPAPIAASKTSTLRRMYRASFAPVVPLRPGQIVAGYRIGGMLGEGGMGAVYQAVHVESGDLVALKVMRPEHGNDAGMAERFEREAVMARRVKSPYVSAVRDFGQTPDGMMYLVMELLRGRSLSQYLDDKMVLPWREAVRIARDVAIGLAAVHDAGVIHRDLKPDNVFLCDGAQVKLLDFGIAKEYGPDWARGKVAGKPLTQAGTVLGTPLYMSPEAVTQSPLGPPTDLYALGAMLFEMVTGRLLFEEEQAVLLMGMHLRVKPDRITAVRTDLVIPRELDALVDQLLAKEPTKRPPSAADVADLLQRVNDSIPQTGGTAPFTALSALEHRRAAAAQPTEITGLPGSSRVVESEGDDTTLPEGPMSAPMDDEEPVTLFDRLPAPPSAQTEEMPPLHLPEPAVAGRTTAMPQSFWWGLPVAAIAMLFAGWWAVRAADTVEPPSMPENPVVEIPVERANLSPDENPPELPLPSVVAPAEITVRFELVPADATVTEDGVAVGSEHRMLLDGRTHEFLIEAPARLSRRVSVVADQDRTVQVVLARRRGGSRGDTTGAGTTGGGTTTGGGDIAREF